jgi:predicted AAA+ superfamily ATPase
LDQIKRALERSPVVALLGPRQCGKTTLAREFLASVSGDGDEAQSHYFDMEDPVVATLFENPMTALQGLKGLVVIDEAQRQPKVFPILRVLADRSAQPASFLVIGSASPELGRQAAESLAGRVEIIGMQGFGLDEVSVRAMDGLWHRGGFPRSFLAANEEDSLAWRKNFIRTFLERDLAALGFGMAPAVMGRFWSMLAHYHGQVWNGAEIAASLGIAPNSARSYLDALEQTFLVRRLPPWHESLGKRLVKAPKLYFRDTGLLHALLGARSASELLVHPKLGASWEGFALEAVLRAIDPDGAYFYAVHNGSKLDLLMFKDGRRVGVEFKRADAPARTRSMTVAMEDLRLDDLWVVYPGSRAYPIGEHMRVRPLEDCLVWGGGV